VSETPERGRQEQSEKPPIANLEDLVAYVRDAPDAGGDWSLKRGVRLVSVSWRQFAEVFEAAAVPFDYLIRRRPWILPDLELPGWILSTRTEYGERTAGTHPNFFVSRNGYVLGSASQMWPTAHPRQLIRDKSQDPNYEGKPRRYEYSRLTKEDVRRG
jgi:hypothetical protein